MGFKIGRNLIVLLGFLFIAAFCAMPVSAAENIIEKLNKHKVSDKDKAQIKELISKSNIKEKMSRDYPDLNNYALMEPIKLYELKDGNFLNKYNPWMGFRRFITKDYEIIYVLKDDKGKIIGAAEFRKGKGVKELKNLDSYTESVKAELIKFSKENENKWYMASFGSFLNEREIRVVADWKSVEDKLNKAGVQEVKDISWISGNGYLPTMLYFQVSSQEYFIPVTDDRGGDFFSGNIYRLSDLIKNRAGIIEMSGKYTPGKLVSAGAPSSGGKLTPVTQIRIPEHNSLVLNILLVTGLIVFAALSIESYLKIRKYRNM